MTAKYGTPYFSNYINSDMKPSDIRSMCCRLRLDLRELRKKSGGFFGSGESTGSVGVVTINMPRIAYLSKTPEEFYRRLDHMMDISARSLHIKREVITKHLNEGLYPYTKRYLGSFDNHFSTIGLVGMNEAGLNACWLGCDMTDERTQKFTKEVLEHMRSRLSDYQEEYPGELFNLEATPAESTAYRLAKHDRKRWPDIRTRGKQGRHTLLYKQLSPSGGIQLRYFRRPGYPGRAADLIYLRYRIPRIPGRETSRLESGGVPCAQDRRELQASVLHNFSHLFCVQRARDISAANTSPVPSAVRRRRFTVVSQDITVRYRTGMMARHRSTRTEPCTISLIPH